MTDEAQTLDHAARLIRTLGHVERAYVEDGWLKVGLILSALDPVEIREVAEWVAIYAQTRSGTDSDRGEETSPPSVRTPSSGSMGSDGSTREDPPSPSALATSPNDPLAAGATAPYDWETEGFGGT